MQHPKNFFIRPRLGLSLRDPATGQILPAAGAEMPRSAFWLRRQKDGDVVEVKEAATVPPNATPAATPDVTAEISTDTGKGKKKE